MLRSLRSFRSYLTAVQVAGLGAIGYAAATAHGRPLGDRPVILLALLGMLVVSELFTIPVSRGEAATDEITLSNLFGQAALLIGPLWPVIAAQGVALVLDCAKRRGAWWKQPFNLAQFSLCYAASYLIYHLCAGVPLGTASAVIHPGWAFLAGVAFLCLNTLFIAGVLALSAGRAVLPQFFSDVRWQYAFLVPATALAPVIASCALDSSWLLVFVLTPVVAMYRSGQQASRREHEALHDQLTGLGNRAKLNAVLDRLFVPDSTERHAVLLIDLDHFKDVNDTLGHHVGDALLRSAAEVLRELAPPAGVVARLGGDEFAVVVENTTPLAAERLALDIVQGLRLPRDIEGMSLRVRGSVGLALFPDDGQTRVEVMRRADVALYKAKESRDVHVSYQPSHDRTALDQLTLANDLAALLDDPRSLHEQLYLTYQPLIAAVDGSLHGVECLVRWAHPRFGMLMPAVFLPLAEHAGLTGAIGRHVLDVAVGQQRAWAEGGLDLRVSVNASVPELSDTSFPETVAGVLARHGVRPDRLVIEVTENSLISDPERSSEILRRIRATGAHVSIDDYGSGYSSLAYVKQLEVDELKVDRQFAAGVRDDVTDRIIVQSTIDLAHQLDLRVVAEGIEDVATAALLRDMGCDVLQGYALARPGPAEAITAWTPLPLPERTPSHGAGLRVVTAGTAG